MNEKIISALASFGFRLYEAKVYITLVTKGISTAKEISNICSIPYGKIYEILYSLSHKGFVIILPVKPMKYKAVSPEDLIKMIEKENDKKFEKSKKIITDTLNKSFNKTKNYDDKKGQFWNINGRGAVNKKIENMLIKAEKHIYMSLTKNSLMRLRSYSKLLETAKERGVNIQILINSNDYSNDLSFCRFKLSNKLIECNLISIDEQESIIFEAVPDDATLNYGSDIGMLVTNKTFPAFIENLFLKSYNNSKESGEIYECN